MINLSSFNRWQDEKNTYFKADTNLSFSSLSSSLTDTPPRPRILQGPGAPRPHRDMNSAHPAHPRVFWLVYCSTHLLSLGVGYFW